MKKIKIKFSGFWDGFEYKDWIVYKILTEKYDIEVCDDADYVFFSCFSMDEWRHSFFECCNFPQIRIVFLGENYTPDFNLFDYAISIYPITFGDRHLYFPCLTKESVLLLPNVDRNYKDDVLTNKIYFANFIASHESENSIRGDFFKRLCDYKRVESPGSYLNNMEDSTPIAYDEKLNFQRKCKFTLCFESTKHEGFVTEKIVDAFLADTIPVYYGSDTAKDIFNPNAFIHVSDYGNFDDVIKKIIELDNDDTAYLTMLRQPIFNDKNIVKNKLDELRAFLYNIFDQHLPNAYRRSRVFFASQHEQYLLHMRDIKKRVDDNSLFYEKFSGREILNMLYKIILKRFRFNK